MKNKGNYSQGGAIYVVSKAVVCYTYFEENGANTDGGAIFTYSRGKLYVEHCLFESNRAINSNFQCEGGAIKALRAVYVVNCTFENNYAYDYGGAISAESVIINENQDNGMINTFFISNSVKDNDGGAIYSSSDVTLKNVKFCKNTARVDGGAIYAKNNANVVHSIFESNLVDGALSARCYGGAIRAKDNANINNCTFKNNYAANRGGAVHASTVTIEGDKSTFEGNAAQDYGGAIYTDTLTKDVLYVSFINNNVAGDGGAVYINNKNEITFTCCIFINNKATNNGGAIYLDSKYSHMSIINNVFIGNSGDEGHSVFNYGYYDTINENFWTVLPTTYNNQLVEWKASSSNIQHTDYNPVRFTVEIIGTCYVNSTSAIKMSFVHQDGTPVALPMIADYFSLYEVEGIEICDKKVSADGITICFIPSKVGTYKLSSHLLGMTATMTINVSEGTPTVLLPLP